MPKKYIFVTGGVISGLGKGIITSSIARIIKSRGYRVTCIKIDPYINVDAGTLRPTEHGEVWVTKCGGEIDQDLGNYERFLNQDFPRKNNITTGQVYQNVIRKGDYLGKTVEVIPHIPEEIIRRIKECGKDFDIIVIEIGGTVGDYQNVLFLESARQMKLKNDDDILFSHVSYLPIPKNLGEMKTKPTQQSVRKLREIGIQPDIIVGRSEKKLDEVRKKKIGLFCGVSNDCIFSCPHTKNVYEVPLILLEQEIDKIIFNKLGIKTASDGLKEWRRLVHNFNNAEKEVTIGIVGKYLDIGDYSLKDSYISIKHALIHSCSHLNKKLRIEWINSKRINSDILEKMDGVIVPGGFGKTGIEGKIKAIKYCRENNKPFLGLCLGLQLAVVEYSRNVCGLSDAHSTEVNPNTKHPVIDILPEQKKIKKKGGTMRLGEYPAVLKENSIVNKIYSEDKVFERHRHRYEVNPEYHEILEKNGLVLSGLSPDKKLVEFIELRNNDFFIATQAHPEFTSRFEIPNPLFLSFVKSCTD